VIYNLWWRLGRFQAQRRLQLAAVQEVPQRLAEDAVPFFQRVQMLRVFPQPSQEASDPDIGPARLVAHAMRAADGQRHLTGVLGSPGDCREQQRPGGDRLAMMFGIGQAGEQAPPIVRQRHDAGEQPATRQVLCRETAPTPLVLQFIEHVFTVGSIAIQLPQRQDLAVQRGDQGGIFPKLLVRSNLGKAKQWLCWIRAIGHG
jgi:hypothetical protein